MVLPTYAVELHGAVLCELHASTMGGHLGHRMLGELAWHIFYWPKLGANACKSCLKYDMY